jgi:hypothetical protein
MEGSAGSPPKPGYAMKTLSAGFGNSSASGFQKLRFPRVPGRKSNREGIVGFDIELSRDFHSFQRRERKGKPHDMPDHQSLEHRQPWYWIGVRSVPGQVNNKPESVGLLL